jgi:hypothetical protein
MRKIVLAVASLMFVIAISGCGDDKPAAKSGTSTGTGTTAAPASKTDTGTGTGTASDKK